MKKIIIAAIVLASVVSCSKQKNNYVCTDRNGQDTIINATESSMRAFEIYHQCNCR